MPPLLLPLVAVLLLARFASAGDGAALDAAVAREAAERDRREDEKRGLEARASALARDLVRPSTASASSRAGEDVQRRLREFDRLADRLDRIDRERAEQERRLSR